MSFKRFLKKTLVGGGLIQGHISDALVKHKKSGKPFRECLRNSINETIQEDMPGTSHIYQAGKTDGHKSGIAEQAKRDEEKFRQQHEEHEKDRAAWNKQKEDYENFLDDLEK